MRYMLMIMGLVILFAGCVTLPNSVIVPPAPPTPEERVTNGMTRAAVAAVMDGRVVTGYEIDPATGRASPVEVRNLYGSEIIEIDGISFQVDRYIIRSPINGADVVEADLFPVVYRNGLVVARGRAGLAALTARGKAVE